MDNFKNFKEIVRKFKTFLKFFCEHLKHFGKHKKCNCVLKNYYRLKFV